MAAGTRTHYRTCTLCEAMCGIRIEVEDDRITDIRGDADDPFSRGHVCPKAVALKDLHEDPDRLKRPVRRRGDTWQEIGWEEALDEVADRLHSVQRDHGRSAVGAYLGNPNVHNLGALLFGPPLLRMLRTNNRFSATSVDQLPHMFVAHQMWGHQLLLPVPDIDRTRHMLVLGANPVASNGSLMTAPGVRHRLRAIQERHGKVVVVDPRRTETADLADEHVPIRPGTDALLLLAILHEVLERPGPRLGRLADFCDGLDEVRALAEEWTPERAEPHTGVSAETIRRLAAELSDAGSAVVYGRMGCSTQRFGALCQWAIVLINVVTGNFDRPGGAMFTHPAFDAIAGPKAFRISKGHFGRWHSRVRGLPEFGGELPVACLAEEILTEGEGRIRAMITAAGNPVLSTPNGAELDRAFASLDFHVALDFYVNETTRHADVILPPTGPLEHGHYDVAFHVLAVRNTAKYSPPCFEPEPGTMHDWEILIELDRRIRERRGERVGARLRGEALRRIGPERVVDAALRAGPYGAGLNPLSRGLSLRRLKAAPHGIDLGPLRPALPDRLPGKKRIQLAPPLLVEDLARLRAVFAEAQPSGPSAPDGELLLIGRRHLRSNNSWMHNAERLVRGRDRCTLMVHPDDAASRGLADGDEVEVSSRVGSVRVKAEVTDAVMPGVVSLPHGWGHGRPGVRLRVAGEHPGVSLNDLTDPEAVDRASGNAVLNGVPVRVRPAAPAARP